MDMLTLALLATGAGIGVISGMLGIGGAVMLVPVLVFGFGFSQARAQGTSIGALIPPIGIFAAIQYYRNGMLDVRAAGLIALGFLFGALGGAALVPYVPQIWLKRIFASLLVYVAVRLMFTDPSKKTGAVLPGVAAITGLWIIYGVRRVLGQKLKPPAPPPPKPPEGEIEYHI
ncbi:MAG: sulfite exporter TauE/SafE family protein [Byssovorax sp.]